jgi:hypothetical protein
MLSFYIEA